MTDDVRASWKLTAERFRDDIDPVIADQGLERSEEELGTETAVRRALRNGDSVFQVWDRYQTLAVPTGDCPASPASPLPGDAAPGRTGSRSRIYICRPVRDRRTVRRGLFERLPKD